MSEGFLKKGMLDRRVLVIGGTSGIGSAVTLEFAKCGIKTIVIHGPKNGKKMNAILKEVRSLGSTGIPFPMQVESTDGFLKSMEPFLPVDILVLAFGPFVYKAITDTNGSDWEKTVLLNLALPGAVISKLLPSMVTQNFGRVILFGGTHTDSIHAFRMSVAYAAAKFGLNIIAQSISDTYSPYNIACSVICPNVIDTESVEPSNRARLASLPFVSKTIDRTEIAEIAVKIAMENPSLHNGEVISLDGGISI